MYPNKQYKHLLITAIAGLFITTGCSSRNNEQNQTVPIVKTVRVQYQNDRFTKSYPARVKAASNIRLAFRVAGPIKNIYVDEGDQVQKGAVIAQLDPRDYELQLNGTEAKYREVKAEVERITALYNKGKVSDNDYDKAVSGLKQIKALYESHKNALKDTKLIAPFAGTVTKVFFDEQEIVDAGMPIIALADTRNLEVVAHLPEQELDNKERIMNVVCHSIYHSEQQWPLTLKNIVTQSNVNGLYPAYFKFPDNNIEGLLPGMSVRISFHYKSSDKPYFSVPSTALFEKDNASHVWKVDTTSSMVNRVRVNIIRIDANGNALIEGDLNPDDIIVCCGVHAIHDGEKIKEQSPSSNTNIGNLL